MLGIGFCRNPDIVPKKKIVCLAVSRKMLNYCVAGKEIDSAGVGIWVRPTGSAAEGAVTPKELQIGKGAKPDLLDVVEMDVISHCPEHHQTENWKINPAAAWRKTGTFPKKNLPRLLDSPGLLWGAGMYGPRDSINDRVAGDVAHKLPESLFFIQPAQVMFQLSTSLGGSEQIRGSFVHGAWNYALVLTDPAADVTLRKAHGIKMGTSVVILKPYLCISLSLVPFNGYCFKLIAGVIFP